MYHVLRIDDSFQLIRPTFGGGSNHDVILTSNVHVIQDVLFSGLESVAGLSKEVKKNLVGVTILNVRFCFVILTCRVHMDKKLC